jgi:glycosyltransferase involved in cell wall biosynthesis
MGWQSNAEVRQALVAARALLLPSFSEGLPIVLMEAQALERPVITTYIGGIPELVDQECGWIVPAGSIEHIADAMIAALETSSEQLKKMGAAGRKRVTDAHDISRNTEVLRDLFVKFGKPD